MEPLLNFMGAIDSGAFDDVFLTMFVLLFFSIWACAVMKGEI